MLFDLCTSILRVWRETGFWPVFVHWLVGGVLAICLTGIILTIWYYADTDGDHVK